LLIHEDVRIRLPQGRLFVRLWAPPQAAGSPIILFHDSLGSVELWRGFGFFGDVVVDQHFIARQRSNRLISVILEHPDLLGVGIDEDTAVWVRPDNSFQVLGASCVMVIDAKRASVSRRANETGQDGLGAHDLKVHVLLPGEQYDIRTRTLIRGPRPAGGRK